jgi:Sel1 repeat
MRMRWKPAIAIICMLAASLLWWQYRWRPAERINVLRARAAQGDPKAEFSLGSASYYGKQVPQDYAEARRWYERAAQQGEPRAEDALGYMYLSGQSVPQDYAKALQWYRRSAEHGSAKGQFDLGTIYDEGIVVPTDYAEANHWFQKAANQNYAKAQDALGYMFYAGRAVPQDYAQAFVWYRKSAEQGYAKAEFDLATMYYRGNGVAQNYEEARRWCIKAAKQGNADAQQALKVFGTESSLVMKLEYLELLTSLPFGLWILLAFLVHRREPLDWRNVSVLLLGLISIAISGMNLYVILHGGLGYCAYPAAFRIVRRVLVGIGVLIFITLVLPAKKAQQPATAR